MLGHFDVELGKFAVKFGNPGYGRRRVKVAQDVSAERGQYPSRRELEAGRENALERSGGALLQEGGDVRGAVVVRPRVRRELACANCKVAFAANAQQQRYCSDQCRMEAWKKERLQCSWCGRFVLVDRLRGGEQAARCPCGARYFRRVRRRSAGQKTRKHGRRFRYFEERGWKRTLRARR